MGKSWENDRGGSTSNGEIMGKPTINDHKWRSIASIAGKIDRENHHELGMGKF
jgi:hypothetical protein